MPVLPAELSAKIKARGKKVLISTGEGHNGACSNCGGTGMLWVRFLDGPFQMPSGGKGIHTFFDGAWWKADSEFYKCPVCQSGQDEIDALFDASGLEPEERDWNVGYLAGMDGKEQALEVGEKLLAEMPKPCGWFAIYGSYGMGKSGFLRSVVAAGCRAGISAKYARAEDILRELRSTFGDESKIGEDELVNLYGKFQLLAVDEVDRVSRTEWSKSALFSLLDMRYNRRNRLATLLATNCDPLQMPAGFEYLESRMKSGERVKLIGADLRGEGDKPEQELTLF
jgi:DNA replication protein DnaC